MSKHAATLALTQALPEPPGSLPDGHLALINTLQRKRGKPDLLEGDLIARPTRLTSDQLTCLFTRFPQEELESFARQINDGGGPLLSAHITDDRPIGAFCQATVSEEEGALWLDTFAYWLADEEGTKLARDIDAGIINEASIGWSWEKAQCSVCGQDWNTWDCPHWPGETYQVAVSEDSQETEERLCFLWMLGCTFDEGSLVYRGGHPDTKVGGTLERSFVPILGAPVTNGQSAPHLTHFQLQATRDMASLYQKAKPKAKGELGKPPKGAGSAPTPQATEPKGDDVKVKLKKPDGSVVEVEPSEVQVLLDEGYTLGQEKGQQAHLEQVAAALGLKPKDATPEKLAQLKAQAAAGAAFRTSLEGRLEKAHTRLAATAEEGAKASERAKRIFANASAEDLEEEVLALEARVEKLDLPSGQQSKTPTGEGAEKEEQPAVDDV